MNVPAPNPWTFYVGCGVAAWLLLIGLYGIVTSRNLVHACVCVAVMQAGTYVMLTTIGHRPGLPGPIYTDNVSPSTATVDPLVQALMLTDVVVEATITALLLGITIKIHEHTGSVDPDAVNVMQG